MMGKGNDLRDRVFGRFVEYLKANKIDPDDFGKDAWSILILSRLLEGHEKALNDGATAGRVFDALSTEQLEKMVEDRKKAHEKATLEVVK
jgi:hypothetical protein